MGGELCGAQAQCVEVTEDAKVAVQIVAAFDVEDRGYLSFGADTIDVRTVESEFDLGAVFVELAQGVVHPAEGLSGFETAVVILFRDIDRKKKGVFAALACARQIPLAIGLAIAHAATVVELAIERVDVGIEDESALVDGSGAGGDLRRRLITRRLRERVLPCKRNKSAGTEELAASEQNVLLKD